MMRPKLINYIIFIYENVKKNYLQITMFVKFNPILYGN